VLFLELISQLKLPGYERYALRSRAWVDEREKTRVADRVQALEGANAAAFESVSQRSDKLSDQLAAMEKRDRDRDERERLRDLREAARDEKDRLRDAQIDSLMSYINEQGGNNNNLPPAARGKFRVFCFQFRLFISNNFLTTLATATTACPPPPTQQPARNINTALMPSARLPVMNNGLPDSMVLLLAEWESKELDSFRHLKFPPGEHALGQRYAKRKYLFDTIVRRQREGNHQSLRDSAEVLDRERKAARVGRPLTVNAFYNVLHSQDKFIVRRQKRPNPDNTPPQNPCPAPPPPPPIRRNVIYRAPAAGRGRGGRGRGRGLIIDGVSAATHLARQRRLNNPASIPWQTHGHTSNQRFNG
jgi:hypothetical protein